MTYPALDIGNVSDADALEVLMLDFAPTAAQAGEHGITYFFANGDDRAHARQGVRAAFPHAHIASRDVDDEDWARRSQEHLAPVSVGRITVAPPWATAGIDPDALLVITPSMGFGTGHHATTRLCLAALQAMALDGRRVLDVGTGSGVLALAARMLGARHVVGVDNDADAIFAASENLLANPRLGGVQLRVTDLRGGQFDAADVVTANLTGALLQATADRLVDLLAPGGAVIVSGLLATERDAVVRAFGGAGAAVQWEAHEDGWVGLTFNRVGDQ